MSIMNPNWTRWIIASTSKNFSDIATSNNLKFYMEGTDKSGRREDEDYIEFRFNGPYANEISIDFWELVFDINIEITSVKDTKNFHRLYKNIGIVTTMFTPAINIYKLGSGPDDDQNLLGCALLQTEGRGDGIQINNFGQFDVTIPVQQSTVEANYRLHLDV